MSDSQQIHVIWDCRVKRQKPMSIWKLILKQTGGIRPSSLLILQPPGTDLPQPLCTVMRMTFSKMFVGEDAIEFCYLELSVLLATNPKAKFIIVSDDLPHFVRAFRNIQPETIAFISSQKLQWPLSDASWTKSIQFIEPTKLKA